MKGIKQHITLYHTTPERIASKLGDQNLQIHTHDPELQDRKDQLDSNIRRNIADITGYEFLPVGEEQTIDDPKPIYELPQIGLNNLIPNTSSIYYYHSNHLGSTCYVTDENAIVQQGFLYAPFGEITNEYNSSFGSSVIPKYSFNAKELDEETGFYYYEARYYAPPTFISRDPLFEKYPTFSPYAYCANNPVKFIDPTGMEIWKPDEWGNLIAQDGDDAETLAKFCNTTVENAQKMLSEQGLPSNGEVAEGSKLTMNNVFTRSIQAAKEGKIACLTNEQIKEQTMGMNNEQYEQWFNNWFSDVSDKYNCWGSAITGSQGNEIVGGCGIGAAKDYVKSLREGFSPVNPSDAVFGKTVISFSRGGAIKHGAVYYGTDNNGVVYVYTKNGWFAPPIVSPLSDVESKYGKVSGYHNPNQ